MRSVAMQSFEKQVVNFRKVIKTKSERVLYKAAVGQIKHTYWCTLHIQNKKIYFPAMLSVLIMHTDYTEVTWEDQQRMHYSLVRHNGRPPPRVPPGWSCPDWTSAFCVCFHLRFFSKTVQIQQLYITHIL